MVNSLAVSSLFILTTTPFSLFFTLSVTLSHFHSLTLSHFHTFRYEESFEAYEQLLAADGNWVSDAADTAATETGECAGVCCTWIYRGMMAGYVYVCVYMCMEGQCVDSGFWPSPC